jgi:gas vesicle protein
MGKTERMFFSTKRGSVFNHSRISGCFSPGVDDYDYELEAKLEKFQEKMKNAESRFETSQKRIRDTCLNHSMHVDRTKNLYDQMMETRYQTSFTKTVQKKMKTQKNFENKEKVLKETVEDLQNKLNREKERLNNHIEEERRHFKERIHGMHKKIQKLEDHLDQ